MRGRPMNVKIATCVCRTRRNPGSLKLLDLSGPAPACTGIALLQEEDPKEET
jgi:hypothetical protein